MQRKTLLIYEPVGWLSADELDLLKKLKVDTSLYLNRDVYYCDLKQQKWIGRLEDKLPEGKGIFMLTENDRRIVIVVEARGGQKDGYGKVFIDDGSYYQVQFRKDDCDGSADVYNNQGQKVITASFAHDKLVELHYLKTGEVYIGEHQYMLRHGRGKQFKNQNQTMESIIFNGIFDNDKFQKGYAKLEYYVGDVEYGVYEGHGTLFFDRGYQRKYLSGDFKAGKLDGEGKEYFDDDDNNLKYEGQFVEGMYEGDGSLTVMEPEKRIYRGKFKGGEPTLKFHILDEHERIFQKVTYKNGKIIEIREEFFYNVKIPSTKEITEDEINTGNIDIQIMEKVVYARQMSSVRYYRRIKDENPAYIMQVDPKLFSIKYEGIVNESGALIYSGDMKHILFEGKGILRYAIKNEPRKYFGNFGNGLYDGQGELYHYNNQPLYVGNFRKNCFHGLGKLTLNSIELTGQHELTANELKSGTYRPEIWSIEIDGEFSHGKFVTGIWRYTGTSEKVLDKLLTMQVDKRQDKLLGRMYYKKSLFYEGYFEHYCFHGEGALYYRDGVQKKYEGGFKLGCFDGFGKLFDSKGKTVYEGEFSSGIYNGKGKLLQGLEENLIYEGQLLNGKVTGKGKMLESDGKSLRSEGNYVDCVLVEGFVKIYNKQSGKLVYEGMVKDGLYEGAGVLFNPAGEVSIKGTFSKGELVEGIKKEYHNDGSLRREGPVQAGNYEGHVKEFFYDGKIMFEGEYHKGERCGEGKMYHRNGQPKQIGIFKDNVFYEGDALYFYEDNVTKMFVGKIKNMYYNGHGSRYFENGFLEYEGEFKNGLYDGDGVYYYYEEPGKIKFKGKFGDGRPDGEGEYLSETGQLIYKGRFINWKKDGKGVFYSSTGEKLLEGTFEDDRLYNGYGKILWPGYGNVKYEGEFQNGYQEGTGKSWYTNGNPEYEGAFKGNYFEGSGVLYFEHDKGVKLYEGKFLKGRYHGFGNYWGKDETYEGEYKNGKKHGEGVLKSRDPNIGLVFEGKWELDDMMDGFARIRDEKTKTLLYEGTLKRGKYDGKATKYYKNGKKEYEGTFKSGFYDGIGTKYNEEGQKEYEGEYIRGVITGEGKIYKNGVLVFNGRTLKGVYHGPGTLYDDNGKLVFKGNFNNGEYDGKGTLYHPGTNKVKYEGEFQKGIFEGYGERYNKEGKLKYAGGFNHGKYNGEGALYYRDGASKRYVGTFSNKQFDGHGKLYSEDGKRVYEGDFLNGVYHGNGIQYYQDGQNKPYYEGDFENGVPHGMGSFKYEDGSLQYKGEAKNGTYHGKGVYYYTDGKVKANGSFINGKYNAP